MEGLKYLAKNTGLLAIGQFGTKLLSFFLVPLYTYVLTTGEYGTFDFVNTTVSLLVPLLTLNICDAALRFPLDMKGDENRSEILSVCIYHFLLCSVIGLLLVLLNVVFNWISVINEYPILFYLIFISTCLNGIITCFARGIDLVKEVAISGVISSAVIMSLNVIFLLPLHLGLVGFFLAYLLGILSQSAYLFISFNGWRMLHIKRINKELQGEMLKFSKPLILNNMSWWINGVSNRYVITWLEGIAANGLFSVSYKIASIFTIFQGIFSQAWTLSAVREFDKDDKSGFFSKMYNSYNIGMTIICSILIILSRPIAHLIYSKDFYVAWKYAPFLLISSIFGALSGYIGGIYTATKDTAIFAKTTVVGAIANISLTVLLVWQIGTMGAAIAASASYFVVWVMRVRTVHRYVKMHLTLWRDCLCYIILTLQSCLLFIYEESAKLYAIQIIMLIIIMALNRDTVSQIYNKISKVIIRRWKVRQM